PEPALLPFRFLTHPVHRRLWWQAAGRAHRVPIHLHPQEGVQLGGRWLLLPEIMYHGAAPAILSYARGRGLRVAAVFHDAIPLSHPHLVRRDAAEQHEEYLRALCDADVILPVSQNAALAFADHARKLNLKTPSLATHPEPAE